MIEPPDLVIVKKYLFKFYLTKNVAFTFALIFTTPPEIEVGVLPAASSATDDNIFFAMYNRGVLLLFALQLRSKDFIPSRVAPRVLATTPALDFAF